MDKRQRAESYDASSPSTIRSASTHIVPGDMSGEEELYAFAGTRGEVAAHLAISMPSTTSLSSSIAATGLAGSYISTRDSTRATSFVDDGQAGNALWAASSVASSRTADHKTNKPPDNASLSIDGNGYPASITSSIQHHVYEGGLRYHAFRDGKYAFPNDEVEQNRDDMKHTMSVMLCRGSYFYAPVDGVLADGGEVLDLGTGTGIWAIDVGDKFPNARIEGVDLSPIQPNYVPENVHFFVDDFEEEWVYEENKFDFIHIRHTIHSVKDRPLLLKRALKHLKPGGYLEVQGLHYAPHCDDTSMTPSTPYAFRDFTSYLSLGLRALGSDLNGVLSVPAEMRAAGFVGVNTIRHKNPIGPWAKDRRLQLCGLFLRTAIMDGLRGLSGRPFGRLGLGWTETQIELFLVDVRRHVMDGSYHTYLPWHVVYGMKPMG